MATEALHLLLAQHNLFQTRTRQQLVIHLEAHVNNSPSDGITVTDTSSSTNTLPHEELQPWSKHLGTVMKIKSENALLKWNSELTP